jgi:hypothetical protein
MLASVVVISATCVSFTFKPFVVKTSAVEVSSIVPVEIRAIVFVVDAVTEVAVPNGVVVISIPWVLGLIDNRGGRLAAIVLIVSIVILVYRCRSRILLINYRRRRGRCNIHSAYRKVESDVDRYLGVGGRGNQGAGEDRGEYK